MTVLSSVESSSIQERWSEDQANAWWDERPWVCGFNFLPSTAVNFIEMWHKDSFDPDTIKQELEWAAQAGFNALRTNLHFLIWKHDVEGLFTRLDWFLDTATSLGLDTVLVPFDDCGFGGQEPSYGGQPDPKPGVHNSRAVASPGRHAVMDRSQWPDYERFIKQVISRYSDDVRVLFWDLYNEPGNLMIFLRWGYAEFDHAMTEHSRDLMVSTFSWARAANPSQPLTVGAWRTPPAGYEAPPYENEIDQLAIEMSDIITFHAYSDCQQVEQYIDRLMQYQRPILSTEWMARSVDSQISDQLALYANRKVGCFNWGLVRGRTQTHIPWPHPLVQQLGQITEQPLWFHDLFWPDGTPYDQSEIELIRDLTGYDNNIYRSKKCQA